MKVHKLTANQKLEHIKRINNKCHIPDLVQAFFHVEIGLNPGFDVLVSDTFAILHDR